MPTTFEENENYLAKCCEYQEIMKFTKSREEFDAMKEKLIELSTNLSSSRGTFTPSYDSSGQDKIYHERMAERKKQLKAKAQNLLEWANRTTFENRD